MAKQKLTKDEKRNLTLAFNTAKGKHELLLQLAKYPIVEVACKKADVGRSTYYKWRSEDKVFATNADDAHQAGILFINDLAESKLISHVQNSKLTAIIFWLKNHHKGYNDKIIHEHAITSIPREMTPEEAEEIRRVFHDVGLKTLTEFGNKLDRKDKKTINNKLTVDE